MELEGTTELKDEAGKYAAKVIMRPKFMKLKAEIPPKGYHYDPMGRLVNSKTGEFVSPKMVEETRE